MLRSVPAFTACWMCSIGPVGLSITVGVSLCFMGLALMWYDVYVVVVGRGAPWEHAKPLP